ncbi:MAG TPA: YfhO family protein, partial [bacterium]
FYDEKPPLYEKLSLPGRVYHTPSVVEEYRMVSGNSVGEAYGHLKAALIPNWPLAYGLEEVCYSNSLFLNSFLPWYYAPTQISKDGAQKILNYLNVRYVLGQMPANRELVPQLGAPIPLWRNEGTMPKWFSVEAAIPELVWDIDLQKVDRQFFDFSKICFVTYQPKAQRYERRQVQELERTPCSVTLQARGRGEALLVSSETAYPGWKAEVNGFLRPLEGVNYGFRGLLLRDGEEKVKIAYRPASFRLGLFLSLLVVGIWSALLAGTFFTTKGTTRQPLAEGVNEVTKKKKRQRR